MSNAGGSRDPRWCAAGIAPKDEMTKTGTSTGRNEVAQADARALSSGECGYRAWKMLFDLAIAIHAKLPCIATELGLSVPQCHVLRLLQPDRPQIMGGLARSLGCDASNVTGIVDRLESLGLIERRFARSDRRVRELALTERGSATREILLGRLYDPPAPLLALPQERQLELCKILDSIFGQ